MSDDIRWTEQGSVAMLDQSLAEVRDVLRNAEGVVALVLVDEDGELVGKPTICAPLNVDSIRMLWRFSLLVAKAAAQMESELESDGSD